MAGASKIMMTEGDAPATPRSGTVVLYCKSDHKYYSKDSDGVEKTISVAGAEEITFVPVGDVSATTVQAAIEELDTEKLAKASNLSDVADTVTAFNNIKQTATTTVTGVVLTSTDAKTITGTDTASVLTPSNLFARIPDGVADTTLSGTPKIFCIKDSSGTPYYFKAYPTKA